MNRIRMVKIPKKEYLELKQLKSMIDVDLFKKLVKGFEDVKEGRVRQTR